MAAQITFIPAGSSVTVREGTTVLQAASKARVSIRTRCGGKASCLMCKVQLATGELSAPEENEVRKLGSLLAEGWRLSCQAKVTEHCTVSLPEDPLKAAVRRKLEEQARERDLL